MGTEMFVILWMFLAAVHFQKVEVMLTSPSQTKICPSSHTYWISPEGDTCYFLEEKKAPSWERALQNCISKGGSLASFHSRKDIDVVRRIYSSMNHEGTPYIGLYRQSDGSLIWSDGTPVDFENWSRGYYVSNTTNCATMGYYTGNWYPTHCDMLASYICSTPKRIPCEVGICKNGGYCPKDGINELFPCMCKHGFQGLTCTEEIKCDTRPCEHGGTCRHDENDGLFRCTCPFGYKGSKCQERILCAAGICKNGASCTQEDINGVLRCNCAKGYKGLMCEESDGNILLIVFVCLGVLLLIVILAVLFFVVRRIRKKKAPNPKKLQSVLKKKDHDSLESCHINILDEDEEDFPK